MLLPNAIPMDKVNCLRCGHSWFPRRPERPTLCPSCGNAKWDQPKPGTVTTPELKQIQSNPKDARGLPHVPEGVILKSAQRALYSDLVAKLAEIIARGSPKLVGILRLGIEWAHGELRPNRPKAEESSAIAHPPTSPKKHGTGGNHPG